MTHHACGDKQGQDEKDDDEDDDDQFGRADQGFIPSGAGPGLIVDSIAWIGGCDRQARARPAAAGEGVGAEGRACRPPLGYLSKNNRSGSRGGRVLRKRSRLLTRPTPR